MNRIEISSHSIKSTSQNDRFSFNEKGEAIVSRRRKSIESRHRSGRNDKLFLFDVAATPTSTRWQRQQTSCKNLTLAIKLEHSRALMSHVCDPPFGPIARRPTSECPTRSNEQKTKFESFLSQGISNFRNYIHSYINKIYQRVKSVLFELIKQQRRATGDGECVAANRELHPNMTWQSVAVFAQRTAKISLRFINMK